MFDETTDGFASHGGKTRAAWTHYTDLILEYSN